MSSNTNQNQISLDPTNIVEYNNIDEVFAIWNEYKINNNKYTIQDINVLYNEFLRKYMQN